MVENNDAFGAGGLNDAFGNSGGIGGNTSIVNPGDSLQTAYDALVADTSMGTLSEINRRYMWLAPGTYTDDLSVNTKYVHLRTMAGAVLSGAITYTNWYGTAFGTGAGDSRANAKNIDLPEALNEYMNTSGDWAKYIRITDNLDFTNMDGASSGAINSSTFDGGDFCISNINIKTNPSPDNENALWRANTGTIQNITIMDGKLNGTSPVAANTSYAGFFVGQSSESAIVQNCHLIDCQLNHTHTTTGVALVGLIVGANHGYCYDCTTSGVLSLSATDGSEGVVGGVVGLQTGGGSGLASGKMLRCKSTASITLADTSLNIQVAYFGGLVGKTTESASTGTDEVGDSHFNGVISIDYSNDSDGAVANVGGICGNNVSLIRDCSATGIIIARIRLTGDGATKCTIGGGVGGGSNIGTVNGCWVDIDMRLDVSEIRDQFVGGFGGRLDGDTIDCYAKGSIYDLSVDSTALTFDYYGGFMGRLPVASGVITDCYCAMDPYTDTASGVAAGFIAELTGGAVATDCYWDSDTCGIATGASAGAYDDKTTAEMVANATFAAWSMNSGGTWKQADLVDYPKLFWE